MKRKQPRKAERDRLRTRVWGLRYTPEERARLPALLDAAGEAQISPEPGEQLGLFAPDAREGRRAPRRRTP
jgi:hypothetical protein